MKADAIKHAAAVVMAGIQPTKAEQNDALAEGIELFFVFLADVSRIADAAQRIGECADGVHPSAFRTFPQS
jgi:hypothetical protein